MKASCSQVSMTLLVDAKDVKESSQTPWNWIKGNTSIQVPADVPFSWIFPLQVNTCRFNAVDPNRTFELESQG